MKAQRRHELRENELAKVIKGAPSFWQQSGGKLLAALIAVVVIILMAAHLVSLLTGHPLKGRGQP
mgnify:CR=1 FL=1